MQTINIVLLIVSIYLLWDNYRMYEKVKKLDMWVLLLDQKLCEKVVKDDDRT